MWDKLTQWRDRNALSREWGALYRAVLMLIDLIATVLVLVGLFGEGSLWLCLPGLCLMVVTDWFMWPVWKSLLW